MGSGKMRGFVRGSPAIFSRTIQSLQKTDENSFKFVTDCMYYQANIAERRWDHGTSHRIYNECLSYCAKFDDRLGVCKSLRGLAKIKMEIQNKLSADIVIILNKARNILKEYSGPFNDEYWTEMVITVRTISDAFCERWPSLALRMCQRALELSQNINYSKKIGVATCRRSLATIMIRRRDFESASQ